MLTIARDFSYVQVPTTNPTDFYLVSLQMRIMFYLYAFRLFIFFFKKDEGEEKRRESNEKICIILYEVAS